MSCSAVKLSNREALWRLEHRKLCVNNQTLFLFKVYPDSESYWLFFFSVAHSLRKISLQLGQKNITVTQVVCININIDLDFVSFKILFRIFEIFMRRSVL